MGHWVEGIVGCSSGMVLKSTGERTVFVNRVRANVLVFLLFLFLLSFPLLTMLSWPRGFLTCDAPEALWLLAAAFALSVLAGISYRKTYVFDRGKRQIKLSRRLFFIPMTRTIPCDAVESVPVRLARRLFLVVGWLRSLDSFQLWLSLKDGRKIYLDMSSDRELICKWQQLIEKAVGCGPEK